MGIMNWLRRMSNTVKITVEYSEEKIHLTCSPDDISDEDIRTLLLEALDVIKTPKSEVGYIK